MRHIVLNLLMFESFSLPSKTKLCGAPIKHGYCEKSPSEVLASFSELSFAQHFSVT